MKCDEIIENHRKWLNDEEGGKHADLRGAGLFDADLRGANLRRANLFGADLFGAKLCHADLRGADLRYANLRYANLCRADLRGADLRGADLCDADLRDAMLPKTDAGYVTPYGVAHIRGDFIRIGCEYHSVDDWAGFSDEEIDAMHRTALEWWKDHKKTVLFIANQCKKRMGDKK